MTKNSSFDWRFTVLAIACMEKKRLVLGFELGSSLLRSLTAVVYDRNLCNVTVEGHSQVAICPPPPKLKETFDHYQNFTVNTCILKSDFFNFLTDILQLSSVSERQTEEESSFA